MCQQQICPQMIYTCHILKLHDEHLWEKYANIPAMWDFTTIKTVVCSKDYRQTADSPNQLKSEDLRRPVFPRDGRIYKLKMTI